MGEDKSGNKRYFWLKLKKTYFNQLEQKKMKRQEHGKEMQVIYLRMMLLCLDTDGVIYYQGVYDTIEEELAEEFDEPLELVRMTVEFLKDNHMISASEDGLNVPEAVKCVGSEGTSAERVRKHRERKTSQCDSDVTGCDTEKEREKEVETDLEKEKRKKRCNATQTQQDATRCNTEKEREKETDLEKEGERKMLHCNGNVTGSNSEVTECNTEKEREKEREKEKDLEKEKRDSTNYPEIISMYNDTCVSFPRVTKLSENRKKAIRARLKVYTPDDFKKMFEMAEASSFLKGANSRNWSATFDWLINDSNMAKVLDGNYQDRQQGTPEHSGQSSQGQQGKARDIYTMIKDGVFDE